MSRECQILRVFTREGVGGNHLGVVIDVTGLTTEVMQAITVDLGFSETIFCDLAGDVPTARIFTPGAEIPFAGHPLVGLGWALNDSHHGGVDRIRCGIGEVGVSNFGAELLSEAAPRIQWVQNSFSLL
ncbi:MAG: PhzF family phenazine biosynthesis protein, partial [Acidimicrobiia bacterium]